MKTLYILEHIERESACLFEQIANELGVNTVTVRVYRGDKFPEIKSSDFLLIMGGPMGLDDISKKSFLWLREEISFISKCIDKNIGIIGVCLGAQLLAYTCGGVITKLKDRTTYLQISEIGWFPIYPTNNHSQNKEFIHLLSQEVLHWHSDRIILPPNAELLAFSDLCSEQFFKISNNLYGLQFHIEIDQPTYEKWLKEDIDYIASSYGPNAFHILMEQGKTHLNSTLNNRVEFIRTLYKEIKMFS